MSAAGSQDQRTLNLQFDAHVNNDVGFKIEVISLMIASIRELLEAAYRAYDQKDARMFHSVEHKSRSTVRLLNDEEFDICIKDLKEALSLQQEAECLHAIDDLRVLADSIIRSLEYTQLRLKTG